MPKKKGDQGGQPISARVPQEIFDYIETKVKNLTFGSFSHGVAYLLKKGMETDIKEQERTYHRVVSLSDDDHEDEK